MGWDTWAGWETHSGGVINPAGLGEERANMLDITKPLTADDCGCLKWESACVTIGGPQSCPTNTLFWAAAAILAAVTLFKGGNK